MLARLRAVLRSRTVLAVGVAVSLLVPAITLPRLPHVTVWPVVVGPTRSPSSWGS